MIIDELWQVLEEKKDIREENQEIISNLDQSQSFMKNTYLRTLLTIIIITSWNDRQEQKTLCGNELGEYEKYDNEADRLKIKIKEMQDSVRRKSNQVQDKRSLDKCLYYSLSFEVKFNIVY